MAVHHADPIRPRGDYGRIATPLQPNRNAITAESQRRYGRIATPLQPNRNAKRLESQRQQIQTKTQFFAFRLLSTHYKNCYFSQFSRPKVRFLSVTANKMGDLTQCFLTNKPIPPPHSCHGDQRDLRTEAPLFRKFPHGLIVLYSPDYIPLMGSTNGASMHMDTISIPKVAMGMKSDRRPSLRMLCDMHGAKWRKRA